MNHKNLSHAAATELAGKRVLVVHAHPDDEVLFTGGIIAELTSGGAEVLILTATLGEEGEVIGERYQHLAGSDLLGGFRIRELQDAASAIGARSEHLIAPGYLRDSGMVGSAAHAHPRALVNNVDEAAGGIEKHLAIFSPHAVITYGPDGGYGHPDHIAVHQATERACKAIGISNIWWTIYQREAIFAALETVTPADGWEKPSADYLLNFTNAAYDLKLSLSDASYNAKIAGISAHPTQVWVGNGAVSETNPEPRWAVCSDPAVAPVAYALSNNLVMPVIRAEYLQRSRGENNPWPADVEADANRAHRAEQEPLTGDVWKVFFDEQ
ncbi:PIG-L family deacetylase [Corynebacterium stationis]|uniref:N-acetyl-1-D-myo-inositol-2-amino-2-deoxy-alpha-D-glucopyranoside deacetylase n=2 Tax=Corynebacterium stationis TaxID=1705 RepID=A0AB36CLR6_9CORY|nr:N-acetyl-1-D-myo-inositol-2-amino-2-deoxy-alpha-D-glucopyranoside deacetylase [Corynebacterium stationis]